MVAKKWSHKLLVRTQTQPEKWTEVKTLNLGSCRKPNKEILEVRLEAQHVDSQNDANLFETYF